MLEGSIAFTLSGATNSKFKALFSVWLPDYKVTMGFCLTVTSFFPNFPAIEVAAFV